MEIEKVVDPAVVTKWRKDGLTYAQISHKLHEMFPSQRGFTERSVRRYCKVHGIKKMDEQEIDDIVSKAVVEVSTHDAIFILVFIHLQVGDSYGKKMLKGLLDSKGVHISEGKVAESLQRVDPGYQCRQQSLVDRTNPAAYYASAFGHKLHLDQNEKLIMFGVTHVIAIDGYSRMIVAHLTIPVKNNILIYEQVYR